MALKYSTMLELQSNLIEFDLFNTISGENFSTDNLEETKSSLIMFICNHCPYVIHYHQQIQKLEKDFKEKLNLVAISSNDIVNYPQDGPEKMRLLWEELGLGFPYLYDETQNIAKKYKAECTPEFYLFNEDRKLVYRGRFDETSPSSGKDPDGKDLRDAMYCLIEGEKISSEQYPSMGCNIKWK
jgi:thiol-disulfide isomerase/thioredoxin